MSKSITQTILVAHKPEVVWEFLTKSELISQWLMENNFKPVAGHEFQFKTMPLPNMGFDGNVYCKVLEIVPYKKLSYSWKGGPGNGEINLDSIVVWTLVEKNNGTELFLEHSGFKETPHHAAIIPIMSEGWSRIVHKIAELVKAAA